VYSIWRLQVQPFQFLCAKTSSGKDAATSLLYLTVHRSIAGDVHIYLKFALKVTHPFRKHRFQQSSLNSAAVVRASEISSIMANRKSTMRLPSRGFISDSWATCISTGKVWRIKAFAWAHNFADDVRRSRRFSGGRQQDSYEVLRHLMDGVREEHRELKQRSVIVSVSRVIVYTVW